VVQNLQGYKVKKGKKKCARSLDNMEKKKREEWI